MTDVPAPRTPAGTEALLRLRRSVAGALLVLDFDGTLSPIVPRPDEARPLPGVIDIVEGLARAGAAVALLTGRPADVAAELAGLGADSRVEVVGHYGWQRWQAGELTGPEAPEALHRARRGLAAALGEVDPGVRIEDKGLSLVIHTRQAGRPDHELSRLRPPLAALAAETGLELASGRLVWELRVPGIDKGAALTDLVARHRPEVVLVAGDDIGDLPAFQVAGELRRDGMLLLRIAASGPGAPMELAGEADLVVAGPVGVRALLATLGGGVTEP